MKKLLLSTLATLLCCALAWGQYVEPEPGKVYRILNAGRGYHCMAANYKTNIIETMTKSDNAYDQMWILEKAGNNSVYIKNGLTGKYIQYATQMSELFRMADTPKEFFIKNHAKDKKFYNIFTSSNGTRCFHASPSSQLVVWTPSATEPESSEWVFEDAGVSIDVLTEQQEIFYGKQQIINNAEKYNGVLSKIFTDRSCSELKAEYAAMSDSELLEAVKELPEDMQNMALKIKNSTWGKREKEFRVREYKAYSDADKWYKKLQTNQYSRLNNPTGIYANGHELIYVFVEGEIKDGAFLGLEEVLSTNTSGTLDTLKVGLNIIPVSFNNSTLFVRYDVNTHDSGKVLADYPNIKIHIENGIVNGFFEKGVHTDEDWRDITRNLATHPVIQVKGDRNIYHMERQWITASNCCRETITDAINWWDDMLRWDHELMGWDKGIYGVKFNNLHCAITLDDNKTYMASTAYRTQYHVKQIYKILNYNNLMSNHDNVWGPGHEVGHFNQASIEVMGTSEISANFYANYTMYKMGKYMSRGDTLGILFNDFAEEKAWPTILGEVKMRMWWQLYLYFHMAGNDTEFYPKLFTLLREDGIDPSPTHVQGSKDILHFAEKCCEAANMDLTNFFKVWGFFHPMKQLVGKEYTSKDLTITQDMLDKTLKKMASYSRKAPAIEFIEDRIEPIARTDGGSGNKIKSSHSVGQCGDVGQYTYYNRETAPEAIGYSYTKVGKSIIIEKGTGAVGFKVYNGKGEYKALSNKYKFTIPEELATDPGLKIVAAEGDGDEVVLKPYAETGESAQKEALKYALKVTDHYVKNTDKNGTKVGSYRPGKMVRLNQLKDSAQIAINNDDQSAHTFGEYLTLIDEELENIYKSNALIKINPLDFYTIIPKSNTTTSLGASTSGLKSEKGGNSQNSKKWAFETEDDSLYCIKSKNGIYIASMPGGDPATTTTSATNAAKFRIVSLENGYHYIELDNVHGSCIGYNSDNSIEGKAYTSQDSWWIIRRVEDNQTAHDTKLLTDAIAAADSIISDVLDANELANGNHVLNEGVIAKSDNLTDLVKRLIAENGNAASILSTENIEDYASAAEKLQTATEAVIAAYAIIPRYPSADISNGITWYYLQYNESDKYLSVERSTKRYLNYIMHTETSIEEADDYMLWAFIPTGNAYEYYIFNAGSGCAIFGTSNIEAMGGGEAQPYTLSLDTAKLAFTIGNGSSYIFGTGTYPKLNAKANYYRLVEAFKSDIALLASTNGDSYGRIVYGKPATDESNIYVGGATTTSYIDLRTTANAALIIEKSKEQSGASNTIYYTSLDAETAAAAGSNVVDKNGVCKAMNINNQSVYYIPESFTATEITYTDDNTEGEDIRAIMLPFVPTNKVTTAMPATFGKVDDVNTLTLAYTEFAKNTPMFAVANGESIIATASNVTIETSSKESFSTDYLVASYVGTDYKISTYIKGSNDKYNKATQAGTMAPFEINIKALPGSSNSATTFKLYYDASTGIEEIEAEETANTIYDLTGRKIEKITAPGIYIVNNKKVIVKEVK